MKNSLNKKNIGIFILAHKRLNLLKRTLFALNKFLNKKDLIHIFFDTYSNKSNKKTISEIKKVEKFLRNLNKNKYHIVYRNKNFGMTKNWFDAYSYMYSKYKKVICLEDDIIIKKGFLEFMYYYLNTYEKNKKIMNITGFSTKIKLVKNYPYNSYVTKRSMSWGQGSWRRVWKLFKKEFEKRNHKQIFNDNKNLQLLISGGEDLLVTLKLDYLKHVQSIQVWWIWNILKNKGLCINPINSLISNAGYDGSGTHSRVGEEFPSSKNYNKKKFMNNLNYFPEINDNFRKKFCIKRKTFLIFKYFPSTILNYLYILKLKVKMFLN